MGFFTANTADAIGAGFYHEMGAPSVVTAPFNGTLSASTAHIGTVTVDNPVSHVTVDNFVAPPAVQKVLITNPVTALTVGGAVSIDNLPAVQAVSGAVSVSNFPDPVTALTINNGLSAPVLVRIVASDVGLGSSSGTGGAAAFDGIIRNAASAPVPVSLQGTPNVGITGLVNVGNWPTSFAISTLPAITGSVSISGTPTVAIGNFPATQVVSGSVSVGNFPSVQPVSGSVAISNLPATQAVSGSVAVSNFPATQNVSGAVAITGTPQVTLTNPTTAVSITNANSAPVPVQIVGGQSSFSGSLSAGSAHVGSVSVDGMVKIDTATPLQVTVTNPSTSGGSTSFDGNVTLKAGLAHIGTVGVDGPVGVTLAANAAVSATITNPVTSVAVNNLPSVQAVSGSVNATIQGTPTVALASNAVQVSNTLQIDTSKPLNVTVTNPSAGGGSATGGNRLTHVVPYATGTVVYDSQVQPDVPTPWRKVSASLTLTGASAGAGSGTGTGTIKLEGSKDGTTYQVLNSASLPSGLGGLNLFIADASVYRYYRLTMDESGYTPARGGSVTFTFDAAPLDAITSDSQVNVLLSTTDGQIGLQGGVGLPIVAQDGGPDIPVRLSAFAGGAPIDYTHGLPVQLVPPVAGSAIGSVKVEKGGAPLDVNILSGGSSFSGVLANSTATIGAISGIANTVNVAIVSGASGGSSFSGQLTQNGVVVSTTNGLPTTETGFPIWVETTGNIAASTTATGASRALPQSGLQFIVRVYNSTAGTFDLVIQGSTDGTIWTTISTSGAYATAYTTAAVDAVLPFYRAQMRTGGFPAINPNLTAWYGRGSAEIGPIIRQYGGGQIGITNPLWITSNTNFNVTPYQGSAVVSSSNPLYVQTTNSPVAMNGVGVLSTTALGANAAFTSSVSTPAAGTVTTILATAVSDQTGTFVIQGAANTAGPWFNVTPVTATTANLATTLSAPILFTNYRVVFTNGAAAQSVFYCAINYSRVGAPV